jgi:thiol-disulfide isomerase/thioredoxin
MTTPDTRTILSRTAAAIILSIGAAWLGASVSSAQSAAKNEAATSVAGRWIGTADLNGRQVPFRLDISGSGDQLRAALVNGKERSPASSGSYAGGHLVLHFDYYANTLDATVEDGVLSGTFGGHSHDVPLVARRNAKTPPASADPPNIAGEWEVAVEGPKGEHAWKLNVRQAGAEVEAVIERIDGDTGALYGEWRDHQFAISHFTAAGPSYADLEPRADGTLELVTAGHGGSVQRLTARRPREARSQGLSGPDDPMQHTSLKNPHKPLSFQFPDLSGKLVSSGDPAFKGKALIVSVGGSWCPNCQDEAPFLEELYQRFHSHGLEIVELSFEEESQLSSLARLKAVIKRFGITYTVLVPGTPDQLAEKFPGVANLNCWPTTFFIGRDGLVKAIHAGFSGPAADKDNRELRNETTSLVERLLSGGERTAEVSGALPLPAH